MNLIVDIGNSSAKAAVFDGDKLVARRRLKESIINDLATLASAYDITSCAWSSVGVLTAETEAMLQHLVPQSLHVIGSTPTPLANDYRSLATLGSDRLAAAVGATHLHPSTDLLIIDVGTCITYDFVNAAGHYLGGNISPGIGMRLRAMNQQTARLPLVMADGELPEIGYDTQTALRAGTFSGLSYEIEGYVANFYKKNPEGHVFLTGGNASRFAQGLHSELCDSLVEIGINEILLYNNR